MKLYRLVFHNRPVLAVAVIRADSERHARDLALEYGRTEKLWSWWVEHAEVRECREGEGVLLWAEAS